MRDEKSQKPPSFSTYEGGIPKKSFPPARPETRSRIEGQEGNQRVPTDSSKYLKDAKGFISCIEPGLAALNRTLEDLRAKADGAVCVEMPLSANLVVNSTESRKGKRPLESSAAYPQDVKCEMVLTWGEDSDSHQKRRKCEFLEIVPLPGTKWKISIKPPATTAAPDAN